ncbi:hypothetical protein [Thalassotalea sp. PLHSN55]|uniref:hypothetical protein n=1 Tax=Thalassotalea sp. PLHSN55 TaxID=3435888 RepID=UPI003F8263F5
MARRNDVKTINSGNSKGNAKESLTVNNLLQSMDKRDADSFSTAQKSALRKAIKATQWRRHSIDVRPTLVLPFMPWSFYLVFLFGLNRRQLSSSERVMAFGMFLLAIFIFGLMLLGLILLLLYVFKSALGIDLFANESLGLWDEIKNMFAD